ncbi:hypothetical protein DFQ28_011230 [Apophysomyces sp. BC1034]|nr:hypothetical protein DFQ30_005432 [Apophysomyces sp. BC1015]KAG0177815.1 hypothetical protein DFQ29_004301 [Apophysomyces sp. BC1021]KAG0194429.1 hypothetical protein DFQ28_011230 [Apophysomyces sp. BC1034]
MSLFDDFLESSETAHVPQAPLHVDTYTAQSGYNTGFEGVDAVRLETGYVSTGLRQTESPIFTLDHVQFQLPATLVDMAVANNILVVALNTFHILRIDLDNPLEVEEIEITRKANDGKLSKIFFDPSGRHLIITTDNGENYYLYEKWRRTKQLVKFKGVAITSIAWNKQVTVTDPSTREILIGTKNGLIYETCLEPTDEFFRREEKYFKQVYSIHETTMPITGLHFEQFPVNNRKYFIMATTPTRIYQFIGILGPSSSARSLGGYSDVEDRGEKSLFENLFSGHATNPGFQELPGELPYSQIHFFSRFQELQQQSVAQTFAWLTGPGIYHGNLVFGSQNMGENVIDNAQLLQYPSSSSDNSLGQPVTEIPIRVALTEFHFILLYKDRIRAVCQLNDKVVYEEMIPLNRDEIIQGLTVDDIKKTFWIYTSVNIYELLVKSEDRDVWTLYLEKKQYDTALRYCRDPAQKDKVFTAQARDYFAQRRYQMSAKYFAESTVSFEEVALKFMQNKERDALRIYLTCKLDRLRKNDRTQKTIIAMWLVEIYLSKLNELEDLASSAHYTSTNAAGTVNGSPSNSVAYFREQQEDLKDEFKTFLETYNIHLHKPTTYKLIASHGRSSEMLYYASLIGDFDRVISHWITERKWSEALEVLNKQANPDIFYKFSPVLMENAPHETVSIWMRQQNLNARLLIPALLRYDHSVIVDKGIQNQAIRYLSYVVTSGNTDPAIHNFLLTLYATQPTGEETALLTFLRNEGREMHYNLDYALRLCSQNGRVQSCVHIYSQMGLYEEAVNLALKHDDQELALINADKPDDDALRKRLWLSIAKYVVQEKKDIQTAMGFLKQSDLLKIEDILPFFPDFVLINDFKNEICSALEEYNIHIEDLKTEMDEATKSADSIRLDIRELKSRFAVVNVVEKCHICNFPLLTRQFYVFPCQHAFHADCLISKATKYLPTRQIRRLADLQEQLSSEIHTRERLSSVKAENNNARGVIFPGDAAATDGSIDDIKSMVARTEKLKDQLDDIVANECALCGEFMIKSIDQPFIGDEEVEMASSWVI